MRERFSIFSLCVVGLFVLCSVGFVGCSPDEDEGDDNVNGGGSNGGSNNNAQVCSITCGSAKYCNRSTGTCENKKGSQEACSEHSECISNMCDSAQKKCIRLAFGGEECSTGTECQANICNEGKCGCKVAADCSAGNVCDSGTCRPVIDCPGNNSGKCFKALQLTPPEEVGKAWNVGPISDIRKDVGDFLGSAFTVSLPIEHVITCPYLIQMHDALVGTDEGKAAEITGKYEDVHKNDYDLRVKSGCYQLDMENQIPFTLLVNAGSQWTKHNFIFEFIVNDSKLMKDGEKFTLWTAPSYALGAADHINSTTLSASSLDFPLGKDNVSIYTRYDVQKCIEGNSADSYEAHMAKGRTNCSDAYQVKVELLHRNQNPNWTCDELYRKVIGCKDVLCNYSKTADDVLDTTFINNKNLCISVDATTFKPKENPNSKSDDDKIQFSSDCSDYYSYLAQNPADPSNTKKQPRTCRTAKILLGGINAYIEVKDEEISISK